MSDDIADRMRARLDGTTEHVGDYLNGGEAVRDIRALIADRDAWRARYMLACAARRAAEVQLARIELERDRLRAWLGYR